VALVRDAISFMRQRGILFDDEGRWSIGPEGETAFGRRHFMDLLSAFTSEPLFTVKHGQLELGRVHHASFVVRDDRPPVLLLAGRPWVVTNVGRPSRADAEKGRPDRARHDPTKVATRLRNPHEFSNSPGTRSDAGRIAMPSCRRPRSSEGPDHP
jgi:hypothetical protein